MACLSGFLMGRQVAKVMPPRGRGTIIFTGATASLRGREGFAAFAGAKHALRALAQSMALELCRKASTSRTPSSTAPSTPNSSAATFPSAMR
jgi:NAD(P)-dependent dehydrogenase (short-subunit alcohol dehydrogenase family)